MIIFKLEKEDPYETNLFSLGLWNTPVVVRLIYKLGTLDGIISSDQLSAFTRLRRRSTQADGQTANETQMHSLKKWLQGAAFV